MKDFIVTEKFTCVKTYVVKASNLTSAINKVQEISDDSIELTSLVEHLDNSDWSGHELTDEEKEDYVVSSAIKLITPRDEPDKPKRKRRTKKEMEEARKLEREKKNEPTI